MRRSIPTLVTVLLAGALAVNTAAAVPLGTAFGYQARLLRNGTPISGTVDFRYMLWDDAIAGVQLGAAITNLGVAVSDGLVTTTLDFGNVFDGNRRWLQIEVQGAGDASFVLLTPRQEVLPVPYALWAGAGGASFTLPYLGQLALPSTLFEIRNTQNAQSAGAIRAQAMSGIAIEGVTTQGNSDAIHGVRSGDGVGASGVHGEGQQFSIGVSGTAQLAPGVYGSSQSHDGVRGFTNSGGSAGVYGENSTPFATGSGVMGFANSLANGVYGYSGGGYGVLGKTGIANKAGVKGTTDNAGAYGGWFENTAAGGVALYAAGEVQVGVLTILGGADLAERFETAEHAEPGTVLAIDPDSPGRLRVAEGAYSHEVAGVVSGANALSAGVILGNDETPGRGQPVALSGRVWVRCDATGAPIRPGDLLTTADRPGHAMKVGDLARANGAILGKAMSSLEAGTGLVLVLVGLQ